MGERLTRVVEYMQVMQVNECSIAATCTSYSKNITEAYIIMRFCCMNNPFVVQMHLSMYIYI
jgi:hypothetical protein